MNRCHGLLGPQNGSDVPSALGLVFFDNRLSSTWSLFLKLDDNTSGFSFSFLKEFQFGLSFSLLVELELASPRGVSSRPSADAAPGVTFSNAPRFPDFSRQDFFEFQKRIY